MVVIISNKNGLVLKVDGSGDVGVGKSGLFKLVWEGSGVRECDVGVE